MEAKVLIEGESNMNIEAKITGGLPEWARGTLRPSCPVCGNYLLPCSTPSGKHPTVSEMPDHRLASRLSNGKLGAKRVKQ